MAERYQAWLTTWAEEPDPQISRSDCHAWGSSPNIEVYRTIPGIESDAPGFQKIKITPHLGSITQIGGSMPHPNGKVEVSYQLKDGKWHIIVNIPDSTEGYCFGRVKPTNSSMEKMYSIYSSNVARRITHIGLSQP
jgi:hypothetical protein